MFSRVFLSSFLTFEVRATFETLELKASDAWTLFQSIDHDEDRGGRGEGSVWCRKLLVTNSKALVTRSDALVPNSYLFLVASCF